MRRAIVALLLLGSVAPFAGCSAYLKRISPELDVFRLAILVRPVGGTRCRTTTIPPLALVTSSQTLVWEIISLDRMCKPGDVTIAWKRGELRFEVQRGKDDTIVVKNLRPGRYQYTVTIGGESEDPELEVWR